MVNNFLSRLFVDPVSKSIPAEVQDVLSKGLLVVGLPDRSLVRE